MNQYIKLLRDWLIHFAVLLTGIFLFTVLPYIIIRLWVEGVIHLKAGGNTLRAICLAVRQ